MAAGTDHTIGLRSDGTVVAVGHNDYGQCAVSGWTDIVAIAASESHSVGVRSNGTVVATGGDLYENYDACSVSDWKDILVP